MDESSRKLFSAPPESMNVNSLIVWCKKQFTTSAEVFKEAEEKYGNLKKHHQNLSELMGLLQEIKKKEKPDKNEVNEIIETASEVIGAIQSLADGRYGLSEDSLSVEGARAKFLDTDEGKTAKAELQQEIGTFIKNYKALKAKLNLETQQDVADLTGIDRRYISIIEKGKHKPQFKTLKRLADAFGVEMDQLLAR